MSVAGPSRTTTSCNDAWAVLYPMEVDRQEGHSCYYKALMGLCSSFRGVCARSCKECTVTEDVSSPSTSWWKILVAPSPPSPSPTPAPPPSPPSPKPRLPPPLTRAWSPHSQPASKAPSSPMLGSASLAPMLQGMHPSTQTRASQLHAPAFPSSDEPRTCELRTTYKVVEWGDYGRRTKVAVEVHPWVAGAHLRLAYGAPLRIRPYDVSGGVITNTGPETVDFMLLADASSHVLFFWLDGREEKPSSIGCELNTPSSHTSAASKPSGPPALLALLPQSSSGLKAACPLGLRVSVLDIQDSGVTVKVEMTRWVPDSVVHLHFDGENGPNIALPTAWHGATLIRSTSHSLSFAIKPRKATEQKLMHFTFSFPGSDDFTLPNFVDCELPASPPPSPRVPPSPAPPSPFPSSPSLPSLPPRSPDPRPPSPSPPRLSPSLPRPSPSLPVRLPPPPGLLPAHLPSSPSPVSSHARAPDPKKKAVLVSTMPHVDKFLFGDPQTAIFLGFTALMMCALLSLFLAYAVGRAQTQRKKEPGGVDDGSRIGLMVPEASVGLNEDWPAHKSRLMHHTPHEDVDEIDVLIDDILGPCCSPIVEHGRHAPALGAQGYTDEKNTCSGRNTAVLQICQRASGGKEQRNRDPNADYFVSQSARDATLYRSAAARQREEKIPPAMLDRIARAVMEMDSQSGEGHHRVHPPSDGVTGQRRFGDTAAAAAPGPRASPFPALELPLPTPSAHRFVESSRAPRPLPVNHLVKQFEVSCPFINGAYKPSPQSRIPCNRIHDGQPCMVGHPNGCNEKAIPSARSTSPLKYNNMSRELDANK